MRSIFRHGLGLLSLLLLLAVSTMVITSCGKSKSEKYADNQAKLRQMDKTADSIRFENSELTGQQTDRPQYAEGVPTPEGQEYYDGGNNNNNNYYQRQHPTYNNGYGYNNQGFNNQGYNNNGYYSSNYDTDHRQEPYHQPSTQNTGSHLAAAAVGAAVGGAAGYYVGNRRKTATVTPTTVTGATYRTPTGNSYNGNRYNGDNTDSKFRNGLTKQYNTQQPRPAVSSTLTRTYSSPTSSNRASTYSSPTSSNRASTSSLFGSKRK